MIYFVGFDIENRINETITLWVNSVGIHKRKTPNKKIPFANPCVEEWVAFIISIRENSKRNSRGNVEFPGGNLHYVMSVPYLLEQFMNEEFGKCWKQEKDVWNQFKKIFKIGRLNPRPKRMIG